MNHKYARLLEVVVATFTKRKKLSLVTPVVEETQREFSEAKYLCIL